MHNVPLIPAAEKNAVSRAYSMLAVEMGHVAAAIALYEEIVDHFGLENARLFLKANGRAFPILSAMADNDGVHRVEKRINDLLDQLAVTLCDKTDIICIGAESAWLDVATQTCIDKLFHVVPHSRDANLDRFLSNYGRNVRIHDSVDLTHLCGTTSVIITFAFGVTPYAFYTYPVAYRICGRDTRQSFSELIALDLIDSPLRFYPNDLVEIASEEMTQVLSRSYEPVRRSTIWKLAAF
ncbi:MAG: hypothetical protein AB1568_04300 [Thermodesulfobacteriota bacterium]